MALREEMERQGGFLFKWRSYFPILALPIFLAALFQSGYFERIYGNFANSLWEIFCLLVSFSGLAIRCLVAGYVPKGTSGRNTQAQVAETLNTTGMYSITRNPLYLANFVIVLGIFLFLQVWWLVAIGILGFLLYYERIIFAEEEFLRKKFGDEFLSWANKTPIFLPRFKNWKKPTLPFSLKTVLRREHATLMSLVAPFTFLHIAIGLITERKLEIGLGWLIFFTSTLLLYFILVIMKKKTKLLDIKGRQF